MMTMFRNASAIVILLLLAASGALAQEWPPRGYLDINVGHGLPAQATFSGEGKTDTVDPERWTFRHEVGREKLFDVGVGVFVAGPIGVGVAVAQATASGHPWISISMPTMFGRIGDEAVGSAALGRSETAVHAQGVIAMPLAGPLAVRVFGGPSLIRVSQELITTYARSWECVYYAQTCTTQVDGYGHDKYEDFALGVNLGADLTIALADRIGVGVLLRYSRASVEMPDTARNLGVDGYSRPGPGMESTQRNTLDVALGGLQVAGGVRARF